MAREPYNGIEGGDDVCWLHLVCDECGALVNGTNEHRPGCSAGEAGTEPDARADGPRPALRVEAAASAAPAPAVPAPQRELRWIPASPLVAALVFALAGWIIVGVHAFAPSAAGELAWVHAVALGWLTTVALSVLIRILPGTTDHPWRFETVARGSLGGVVLGAAFIVAGFLTSTQLLAAGGVIATLGVLTYVVVALVTLSPPASGPIEAAISRAFAITLTILAITVLLGTTLALALTRGVSAPAHALPAHATLGIAGWLTMLTTGVGARTLRVILGVEPRNRRLHTVVGSGLLLGVALVALGGAVHALVVAGFIVIEAAAIAFAADAADRALRSTRPNPAARLGVGAAAFWIVVASAAALLASLGLPLAHLAVVAALAGWVGSLVLAHLHHIGVRLIATSVIGEDDETEPWLLTSRPLAIATIATYELAVVALAFDVATGGDTFSAGATNVAELIAAVLGLIASGLLASNAFRAARRARALRGVPAYSLL